MSILAPFFRDFPIRQKQVSQILMKPPSSILIFQPGLGFSPPGAIREDRFWGFKKSPFWHIFGTNSKPQKGDFLKPEKRSSRMALGVGNPSPGWKISIEDDGFIKIWLTCFWRIGKSRKKLAKWIFFSLFWSGCFCELFSSRFANSSEPSQPDFYETIIFDTDFSRRSRQYRFQRDLTSSRGTF